MISFFMLQLTQSANESRNTDANSHANASALPIASNCKSKKGTDENTSCTCASFLNGRISIEYCVPFLRRYSRQLKVTKY